MTSSRRPARIALILLALVGCKARSTAGERGVVDAAAEGAPPDPAASAGPRCVPAQRVPPLGLEGDLEFGAVAHDGRGIAVGLVRQGTKGTEAAVALLPSDAAGARVASLGPVPPEAPPPVVAWRGPGAEDVLAIAPSATGTEGKAMRLYHVGRDGTVESNAAIALVRGDWPAVDIGASSRTVVVAWDAVANEAPPRGVIRVATLEGPPSFRPGAPRDISLPGEDAEGPRIARSGQGFAVVWAASWPESSAPDAQRPGRWLEVAFLDQAGLPVGAVTRLTSTTTRVASFDAATLERADRGGGAESTVVARFEREGNRGAALRFLRVLPEGAVEQEIAPTEGMGPGAPSLLLGPHRWVSWMGEREQVVLLPLDEAGNAVGSPSEEDAFDGAQPLLAFGASEILAATPASASKTGRLDVFSCRP